ncbi:MAG: hypothetical protein KF809_19105 [Chloroflexi bacterium]|nr:hypothetical protein [Chloroflexota bacterium]
MRVVGVREFRDQASAVLNGNELVRIERNGTPIGFYVPLVPIDRAAAREAADRQIEMLEYLHARTGLSEEEFVREIMGDDYIPEFEAP